MMNFEKYTNSSKKIINSAQNLALSKKHQKIAIVMGSQSDYSTMKDCVKILKSLKKKPN